jgi:hypothetical protein
MIDIIQLAFMLAAVSTLVFGTIVVWLLMGYYSLRILRSLKGGILSKGWEFICVAVPFLILGQLATSLSSSSRITSISEQSLQAIGALLSLTGGIMIVIGFRTEYKVWNPKGMPSAPAFNETELSPQQEADRIA